MSATLDHMTEEGLRDCMVLIILVMVNRSIFGELIAIFG